MMRKLYRVAGAVLLCCAYAGSTEARPGHGGAASPIVAPILTDATVNFGLLTRTGYGGVSLSAQDVTTAARHPVTFSGLGLMSPSGPPCDTWTDFEWVSNSAGRTASDWTIISANTPEGSTAITPVPTSTGQGHLAGDTVFRARCSANGNLSNWATLTYKGVNNAVNIGPFDRGDFGVFPAGFGGTAGAKILVSTGTAKTSDFIVRQSAAFTNQVTLEPADAGKYPNLLDLQVGSISNMKIAGFRFSGDQTALSGNGNCTVCGYSGTYSDLVVDDVYGYFSETTMNKTSPWTFTKFNGCASGCSISNFGVEYTMSGIYLNNGTSATVSDGFVRYIYNNAIQADNAGNWTFSDLQLISPNLINNAVLHVDFAQISNGATPPFIKFNRILTAQADGFGRAQGITFGGGGLNAMGYATSGTLTLTSGSLSSSSNGAHIFSSAGSPMAPGDNITITGGCGNPCGGTTATLSSAISIGSAEVPVPIFTYDMNIQVNGLSGGLGDYNGFDTNGEQGTSFLKNATINQQDSGQPLTNSFTGTVNTTTKQITIAGPITTNIADVEPYIGADQKVAYAGCDFCITIGTQVSGTTHGAGVYNYTGTGVDAGPISMASTFIFPQPAAARFQQNNCSVADLHGGTFTVDGVYYQGGNASAGGCPPANTSITNFFGAGGTDLTGDDFLTGALPKTTLEAITPAAYRAMTPAQVLAADCNAKLPATGGHLDAGDGDWFGAYTQTGEWNDGSGTAIVGCGVH